MLKLYKAFNLPHFYYVIILLDKGYVCMYVCIKIARITNLAKEESYKFKRQTIFYLN